MKFAFINDNEIKKIEDHESMDSILDGHHYQVVMDITDYSYMPKVGWLYSNGNLFLYCPPVTARQIRRALLTLGITGALIEASLGGLPEPTRSAALIEWEYSNEFFRTHELVPVVSTMLGWNAEQVDALWLLAGSL